MSKNRETLFSFPPPFLFFSSSSSSFEIQRFFRYSILVVISPIFPTSDDELFKGTPPLRHEFISRENSHLSEQAASY